MRPILRDASELVAEMMTNGQTIWASPPGTTNCIDYEGIGFKLILDIVQLI